MKTLATFPDRRTYTAGSILLTIADCCKITFPSDSLARNFITNFSLIDFDHWIPWRHFAPTKINVYTVPFQHYSQKLINRPRTPAIPLFYFKKLALGVDKTVMEEAREKPKILLLRAQSDANQSAESRSLWTRLSKALNTFTELVERELLEAPAETLSSLTDGFDFTFLDTNLASWSVLKEEPRERLCLVQANGFNWSDIRVRHQRLEALTSHPLLVLESINASDLLRALHLFLIPKRLAGVTPLMEKGALILGEKVMEPNSIGLLLDRISTFYEKADGFALKQRIPDLRQVLSALLLEGLNSAKNKGIIYPCVDFQVSANKEKIGVNLRFPFKNIPIGSLVKSILDGSDLFWHQIWQCSDVTLLTFHKQQEELEVMLLLTRPERNLHGKFRTLLSKTSDRNPRKEDLLDPPHNYQFMLASEIQTKDANDIQIFSTETPAAADDFSEIGELPEPLAQKVRQITEQNRVINNHLNRKDEQLQELVKKNLQLTHDLNTRRGEIIKANQLRDTLTDNFERKIRDLEGSVSQLRDASVNETLTKNTQGPAAFHEVINKLEGTIRAAENEKNQLRENVAYEQKKVATLEQKYSHLYKELSLKDREINELKNTLSKWRKDQAEKPAKPGPAEEKREIVPLKTKELEDREVGYKQEIKKLSFKIEAHEKNFRAVQNDAAEKQKLLDQKLKEAKSKEVELLKRIEELTNSLKKAIKAA